MSFKNFENKNVRPFDFFLMRRMCLNVDNITQPNTLTSGAEFDAAPMRLRGSSDASSGGSVLFNIPTGVGFFMFSKILSMKVRY